MSGSIFFNAHHSPVGAFATFTLGCDGGRGGLGLELGDPPGQNVFIGLESRDHASLYQALPFYAKAVDDLKNWTVEQQQAPSGGVKVVPFTPGEIARDFTASIDTWRAGDLTFAIYSPVPPVPDPDGADVPSLKRALLPAVFVELTIDNSLGSRPRTAFFGYQGNDPYSSMRQIADAGMVGVGQGLRTAICTKDPGVRSGMWFGMEQLLAPRHEGQLAFGMGNVGALLVTADPGVKRTCRFAVCFFRAGRVTAGIDASYYYTRYFTEIEQVASYALDNFAWYVREAERTDSELDSPRLSHDQRFMLHHAVRSYYGSTELLDWQGRPFWIVGEGQYRNVNTFDLLVDQCFFELRRHPWTVRNVLDLFADRYRYTDTVSFPGGATEYPGGISFTHDMGVANTISPEGTSSYEIPALHGCFSYMTQEQLVNWILCAAVYDEQSGDRAWLRSRLGLLEQCLDSMCNRDHPDPAQRNGIMGLDSTRCRGGAEITTYDSLDTSLGQARNNLYLAVKCWAAYVALARIFGRCDRARAAELARSQARRCADSIAAAATPEGYIPAIIGEGSQSRIIPAIEGLIFPWAAGSPEALEPAGPYGALLSALKKHLETVLAPGECLFDDGGWKISSTSRNSWLSKIYLSQFVARKVLGMRPDDRADAAHVAWLTRSESAPYAWSDQMVDGVAKASRYYPRGVTAVLWLEE